MYYLQSRYYDPEVGRFVNADEASTVKLYNFALQANLFSYCLNSPTNSTDITGQLAVQLIAKIILGVMLGFLIQLICDLIESWYITLILGRKDNRRFCVGDYLASMLSWSLVFLSPVGKTARAVLAVLPYVVKVFCRLLNGSYSWGAFAIDLISAVIAAIVAVCLGKSKATTSKLSKIKTRFAGSKNASSKIAKSATNAIFRMNKWGFRLSVAINISNALMQLLFNLMVYKKSYKK